jgi:ComF family protein
MLGGRGMFPVRPVDVNGKGVWMSTIGIVGRGLSSLGCGFAHALASAALPPVCCLCSAPGQAPGVDLCDVCATFLPVLDDGPRPASGGAGHWPDQVQVPGLPVGDGTLVRTLFLFKYEYPVDHFIRALKFRGERVYARVLGQLMARSHRARGWAAPACIVPMPLHFSRFRERGFNQAQQIAGYAGASLGVRVDSRSLVRALCTKEQSGLSLNERRDNVRGAFKVARPLPAGRIALVDDVVTTGSTAMAAVRALAEAGAKEIELWAAARVEKDCG